MIVLPQVVLDLLDEGRADIRGLLHITLGSGQYGFIRSAVAFDYNGLTYEPGGLIEVSDIATGTGITAQQFTLTLAASPDDGLTPEVLQTIENEDYRDRPVVVSDAYFHPDTGALLHVQPLRRGYIDTIDHIEDRDTPYTLIVTCETRALDYTRTNGRVRSVADQQRRSEGDLFFEHAAKQGRTKVWWGQKRKGTSEPISDGRNVKWNNSR